MDGVAELGMDISAVGFAQQYAVSVQKLTMDTEKMLAQEVRELVQKAPVVPKGEYLDVFA